MALMSSPPAAKPSSARAEWPDLNILRGLAVVFMIIHHTWARTGMEVPTPVRALVEHGSAAPVLFFLSTGLGYGVGGPRSGPIKASAYKKVGLLLLADALMTMAHGHLLGLNFLGFIGLSSLVLEVVTRTRRPVAVAVGLGLLVVVGRFVLGYDPVLLALGLDDSWVAHLLGARGIASLAYPFAPWLAYPMVGYVIGDRVRRLGPNLPELRPWLLLVVAVAGEGAAYVLVQRGFTWFRWTVVSHAYFVFSVGVIALAWLITRGLAARPALSEALSMRGVSSLAVVPIHYAVIALYFRNLPAPTGPLTLLCLMLGVGVVAFILARRVDDWSAHLAKQPGINFWALPLLGITVTGLALLPFAGAGLMPAPWPLVIMVVGQLVICVLLALPWPAAQAAVRKPA